MTLAVAEAVLTDAKADATLWYAALTVVLAERAPA